MKSKLITPEMVGNWEQEWQIFEEQFYESTINQFRECLENDVDKTFINQESPTIEDEEFINEDGEPVSEHMLWIEQVWFKFTANLRKNGHIREDEL